MARRTQRYVKGPRNGLYAHRAQADRVSLKRSGVEAPDFPSPSWFLSAAISERVAAERNDDADSADSLPIDILRLSESLE
jgi:hypothetical protein